MLLSLSLQANTCLQARLASVYPEIKSTKSGKPLFTREDVLENARLSPDERASKSLFLLGKDELPLEEQQRISQAIERAHQVGSKDSAIYEYTWPELREKYRLLREAGLNKVESDFLIRSGLAGRPPTRTLFKPTDNIFADYTPGILDHNFPERVKALKESLKEKPKGLISTLKKRLLGKESEKVYTREGQHLVDQLQALYFIDHAHQGSFLKQITGEGGSFSTARINDLYTRQAFTNYLDADAYLTQTNAAISKETFLRVHKEMMKNGVENVPAEALGTIRNGNWFGNVTSKPIGETELKQIKDNPYLTWQQKDEIATKSSKAYKGKIFYPNTMMAKPPILNLLKERDPKLVEEILDHRHAYRDLKDKKGMAKTTREKNKIQKEIDALKPKEKELNQRLVNELFDERIEWFNKRRAEIGELNTYEKFEEYVDVLARFQRDLVSIHPFPNGNGRTTRQVALYHALTKEGFPPPRIMDTNMDIYANVNDWAREIKRGIVASDHLIDDLTERAKYGLAMQNSPFLKAPITAESQMSFLRAGKTTKEIGEREHIDPRLYSLTIDKIVQADKNFPEKLKWNPGMAWQEIQQVTGFQHYRNNLYYKHPKNGIERVEVAPVDNDFKTLFGKASYDDPELYQFKMDNWYMDEVNWRGLASKQREKSEDEIIGMFRELSPHMTSNQILRNIRSGSSPEKIRDLALADFKTYNDDLYSNKGLVEMAKDHSETGPKYGTSYGYSTSKNRAVGKAFAMGAMVVGDYGKHATPELQALLKSRVLVGARRARKDVDLGRLKQVREEFSYKYGRQQEVMGIGAADPDSISIIQTIDAEGEVMQSYLRNPENPAEIWVIKGEIGVNETPSSEQLIKTINLNDVGKN